MQEPAVVRENHGAVIRELPWMQKESGYVSRWTPKATSAADAAIPAQGMRIALTGVGYGSVKIRLPYLEKSVNLHYIRCREKAAVWIKKWKKSRCRLKMTLFSTKFFPNTRAS
jgi:hypothetical protein